MTQLFVTNGMVLILNYGSVSLYTDIKNFKYSRLILKTSNFIIFDDNVKTKIGRTQIQVMQINSDRTKITTYSN